MNKYINSNPWQRSGILKAHALNDIQKRNTIQVNVAAVLSKFIPVPGYQCSSTKSRNKLIQMPCFAMKSNR